MKFLGMEFTFKRTEPPPSVPPPTRLPEPYASITDREVGNLIKPARLILAICEEMCCEDFITDDGIVEVEIRKYEDR